MMTPPPNDPDTRLFCKAAKALVADEPGLADVLGFHPEQAEDDAALMAEVVSRAAQDAPVRQAIRDAAQHAFVPTGRLFPILREDVMITALRDGDPGGAITTLLFANGLHNLLGYRLTNATFATGRPATAHALKTHFLRAFGADIMPQSRIGRRVWIDHGLGVVIGQTAVIEDDVSLWHGVTLGTNMVDRGDARHPRLRRGCIIGAGASIIGPVEIGAGAVIAAGTVVTEDVPAGAIAVGAKVRILEGRARSAAELGIPTGELT